MRLKSYGIKSYEIKIVMKLISSKIFILISLSTVLSTICASSLGLDIAKWTSTIDHSKESKESKEGKEHKEHKESRQSRLDNNLTLLFIYSSTCQYCQRFAPVFKKFVQQTEIQYTSLTADGGLLEGFAGAIYNPKLLSQLPIKSYPTVLATNQKTQQMVLLSQGYITLNDLYENYKVVKGY